MIDGSETALAADGLTVSTETDISDTPFGQRTDETVEPAPAPDSPTELPEQHDWSQYEKELELILEGTRRIFSTK